LASAIALAAGCVSDDEGPTGPKYPTEGAFCTALAEVVCSGKVVEGCYGANNADNAASCKEAYRSEGCNAGNYEYHPEGAEKCIEKMKAIYADGALTQAELDSAHITCLDALSDSGGPNAVCTVDDECHAPSKLRCVIKTGTEGTCQVPEEVGGGIGCGGPSQVCAEGFYCNGSNCVEDLGGRTCSDTDPPCGSDEYCEIIPATMMGQCVAKIADGQMCTTAEECSGGFCQTTCRSNLVLVDPVACAPFLPG
jgi:hypothetical protein